MNSTNKDDSIIVQVESLTVEQAKAVGVDRIADENCVVTIPVSQANELKINTPK
jgi:hypothetical protein